ncbi:ATP-binding protein [Vulgatibacter incomptus]|uniref:Chromosome partition protein smc n=1 Tax=Vulgatibacter incomptus TaxID=1391653 RepID=A0A0K1PD06_9BACT|nr:hypothetical protein [Vulgatibacter incomptus]AKU91281.1 Chromosome partition protein smc [Vulgatibacter incomptus]
MRLHELILQGWKGFPAQLRLAFTPGIQVLHADADPWPALEALLYPDDGRVEAGRFEAPGAASFRAALTLRSQDGTVWRIVRDLRGASALQRLDSAAGKFENSSTNVLELGPYLRSQLGLPGRTAYASLFRLSGEELPSARPVLDEPYAVSSDASVLESLPPLAEPTPVEPVAVERGDPAAVGRAIAALEAERNEARKVEGLQRQVEEIEARLREVDEHLGRVERLDGELASAIAEAAAYDFEPAVADDLGARLASFDQATARRDEALARLQANREGVAARIDGPGPRPLEKDWRFWAGVGAALAFWLIALITPWKVVALLAIPSFGLPATLALMVVGDRQRRSSAGRRTGYLGERERKASAEWDEATLEVRRAMSAVGVEEVGALAEWLRSRATARERVVGRRGAVDAARAAPEFRAAAAARPGLEARLREVEGAVAAAGMFRTVSEIDAELERLRQDAFGAGAPERQALQGAAGFGAAGFGAFMAAPPSGLGALPSQGTPSGIGAFQLKGSSPGLGALSPLVAGSGGSALPGGPRLPQASGFGRPPSAPPATSPGGDPSSELLGAACAHFLASREELLAALGGRASSCLAQLSGARYERLTWTGSGAIRCGGSVGEHAFGSMAARDRDSAYLALRLAILDSQAEKRPFPVILDDPFAGLDAERQALVARILLGIAARTQILHRTRLASMREGAQVLEAK